ncbi:MAG: carboxypeptidase-like regulatory domain-containing protein [Cytophagales bacterium]|nr:carboxypeptidase-like regulatory domain-containing protein [Cytophagales bacterium]
MAASHFATSQGGKLPLVQFSGIVVGGDSLYGIPGVYVYVRKAGRGTITNDAGYFSMATLAGDSVKVNALGYKEKVIVVPKSDKNSYTIIVELVEDTTYYPIVEIFPYPTEEVFKQAFLSLQLPDQLFYSRSASNLNPYILQRMVMNYAMNSNENYKYSLRSQLYPGSPAYISGVNFNILNPFAWSSLIKQARRRKN